MASTNSGIRSAISAGSPRRKAGAIEIAISLNAMTLPSPSSTIAASGKPSISCSINRACGSANTWGVAGAKLASATTSVRPSKASQALCNRVTNGVGTLRRSSFIAMLVGVGFFRFDSAADRFGQGWYHRRPRRSTRATQVQPNFPRPQNCQGQRERDDVVEQPEKKQTSKYRFLVELPQRHQHGGIEHAKSARRMTCKAEQRRRYEDHRHRDK